MFIVTVLVLVILKVKPITSPAAVPGTTAGDQFAAVLQVPFALTFQFPEDANVDEKKRAKQCESSN